MGSFYEIHFLVDDGWKLKRKSFVWRRKKRKWIEKFHVRRHLDHKGAHIFLLHDYGIVARTVWEARCVVVNVLDLDDDLTLALAGRRAPAAPAIVHCSNV